MICRQATRRDVIAKESAEDGGIQVSVKWHCGDGKDGHGVLTDQ